LTEEKPNRRYLTIMLVPDRGQESRTYRLSYRMLRALGMRPRKIVREVVTESTLLLLIGAAIGNVLGWISVLPFARSGLDLSIFAAGMDFAGSSRIVYPVTAAPDVAMANFVVIGLGILICLYPAIKAARFKPVEAMAQA